MARLIASGCFGLAVVVAVARVTNPPIEERMNRQIEKGRLQLENCQYESAYVTFRIAATLDGSEGRARNGMRLAAAGLGRKARNGDIGKCDGE